MSVRSRWAKMVAAAAGVGLVGAVVLAVIASDGGGGDRASDEEAPRVSGSPRPPEPPVVSGQARVAGYVRDVNGHPVPGARVRVAGTVGGTRASARGRYELRVPAGRPTLVAGRAAYAAQYVQVAAQARRRTRLDFSLAVTSTADARAPNSADVLIFWTGCATVARLGAAELDRLVKAGVDGFVCSVGRLRSMGGEHRFSGDPSARLRAASYRLQRKLRKSVVARRARSGRLRVYLGFSASDATNPDTPFKEWFDDRAWARGVLAPVRELAAAARSLGFVGLALDQELYAASGGAPTAQWTWDYPGGDRPESEVRAQVRRRGRQLMNAMLAGYPGLELAAYDTQVPDNWKEQVQEVVNDQADAFASDVRIDLWDGLSSVQGYAALRWFDAIFYKTPHLGADWPSGLAYNANSIYGSLSRRFSNWSYASSRLHVTPFSWIDEGPSRSTFDDAKPVRFVAHQLEEFRRWGTGGVFANYAYRGPTDFDYEPYAKALRSASTPGTVDREPPELTISSPAADGDRLTIEGTVRDRFGIRVVRWYDGRGRFGTAELVWDAEDPLTADRDWLSRWRIEDVPLSPGANRITVVAEDIKGLARVRRLVVRR